MLIIIANEAKFHYANHAIILKFIFIDVEYQETFLIISFDNN